jgi:GTP-binding protein
MSKKILPTVVIVGRTNVGKSTLFNRLSENVKSIATDYEGVTRDFVKDTISWQGKQFDLIDTGGISLRKTQDVLLQETRERALSCMQQADILLFVCDGTVGIVQEDHEIAKVVRKLNKKTALILNKADSKQFADHIHEFERLGIDPIISLSAQHGKGMSDLLDFIVTNISEPVEKEIKDPACKVVFFGKPNVGKSSLLNLLLKQDRAIVSNIPGTTREALSERITFYQEDILLTDTPGVRRKRVVTEDLEGMMVKSSMHALEQANVVLLLVDASEGKVVDQELKLAFYAFKDRYKALIILFNKQDLMTDESKHDLAMSLSEYEYMLKKVVQLSISCKSGKNVGKILPLINTVWKRYSQTFSDEELTMVIKEAMNRSHLFKCGHELHVYSARQVGTAPITIVLRVNNVLWFEQSSLNFFDSVLRQKFDLQGIPVRFLIRGKR